MLWPQGPNIAVVTACTTGLHAIGDERPHDRIRRCDVMVCGGSESSVTPLAVGGFASAKALSTRNDDPATASRPWDKDRDGFVLGEGVPACWCSRSTNTRSSAGARIYAELFRFRHERRRLPHDRPGYRRAASQHGLGHAERGHQSGSGAYLNAHGTSTPWATRTKPKRSSSLRCGCREVAGGQFPPSR